jgi:hypothetical protein
MSALEQAFHRACYSRARLRRAYQQLDPTVEDLENVPANRDDGGRTNLAPADIHFMALDNDLPASIRTEGLPGAAVDHAGAPGQVNGFLGEPSCL